ncbi:hypothetical protein [Clostridium senegalense]|uniref:hypothetical protein n=1 Tax=Clostridium senegalense TaxID=1465809 RepID=UPI001C10756B|nr:hypothetical protein [Clostridium senegalense]MBU5227896.1 hypothetical protein [Clostridium senegalense]
MNTINLNFDCKVLDENNPDLVFGAAECLAETFAGVKIGKFTICEPMAKICNLSKEDMMEFTTNYIKDIVNDGLCVVAVDSDTNKVIGAMACENYTPSRKASFEIKNESINNIFGFLGELDKQFFTIVEKRFGRKIRKNEYVRGSMLGVRTEFNKKYVAQNMLSLVMDQCAEKGFKAFFVEATNFKSQKFNDLYGFYTAKDLQGKPISKKYCDHKIFHQIPEDVALECLLMIKPVENAVIQALCV